MVSRECFNCSNSTFNYNHCANCGTYNKAPNTTDNKRKMVQENTLSKKRKMIQENTLSKKRQKNNTEYYKECFKCYNESFIYNHCANCGTYNK